MEVLKSAYGSVRPYTRHQRSCPHRLEKDYNACSCSKWLYIRERGKKKKRISLTTPSFTEAQQIAADRLRAMDPEIAAARAASREETPESTPLQAACDLWLKRTEREHGKAGSYEQYAVVSKQLQEWAKDQGIEIIQEITTGKLDTWYSSRRWTKLAASTRRQRWVMVRTLFRFWHERGLLRHNPAAAVKPVKKMGDHVQGPYTTVQADAVLRQVNHDPRLRAFVLLLLRGGCDVIDAVLFTQSQISDMNIGGQTISVYRYRRTKTDVEAVVPLDPETVAVLRSVPVLPENPPGMPFRDPRLELRSDRSVWSGRVREALKLAKVRWVELPTRDDRGQPRRKAANCKQFRHTFAVQQLVAGQRPEEVAKMLGHVSADMVRVYYAPWVRELDTAHISRVVGHWAATAPTK